MEDLNYKSSNDGDEFDLKVLKNFFFRNKNFIASVSFVFLLIFLFFASFKKKIWEGKFQIVLNSNQNTSLKDSLLRSSNTEALEGLAFGSDLKSTSLNTEVGILESPSVLFPIFNFVNIEKKKKNPRKDDLIFSEWKKGYLKIALKNKTSILNISYSDNDKEIILPVLEKISIAYQTYSGKTRKKNIKLAKEYLNSQINKYKLDSKKSLKAVQTYAMDQDLLDFGLTDSTQSATTNEEGGNNNLPPSFLKNIDVEQIRVTAANRIRNIDKQIEKIESLENNIKDIQYIGSTIPGLLDTGLPQLLESLENEIVELNSKFTNKDRSLIRLKEKRLMYIKLLKERSIGYLKAQRIAAEALMESAMRPKGVLLKYKELMRNAARDEETLVKLENELRSISLEEARLKDPWELITKPTISKDPLGLPGLPIPIILIMGLLIGFTLGIIISLIKEFRSGYIFEQYLIEDYLDTKIIDTLDLSTNLLKIHNQNILKNEILNISSNQISYLITDEIFNEKLKQRIIEFLGINNDEFNLIDNLREIKNNEKIILITSIGAVKHLDIINIKNRLSNLNLKINGVILLDKINSLL